MLECLELRCNWLSDDIVQSLTNALCHNQGVTAVEWVALSAFQQNTNSASEEHDLSEISINDHVAVFYADAPANNSKLQELWNLNKDTAATATQQDTFMCNKSSIMSTYPSDHTFEELSCSVCTKQEREICLKSCTLSWESAEITVSAKWHNLRSLWAMLMEVTSTCILFLWWIPAYLYTSSCYCLDSQRWI